MALGYGAVATALSLVGLGAVAILVFLGSVSLATWVVAWMKVREHYRSYGRREAAAGLVLTIGLMVALAPVYILGGGEGPLAYGAAILSIALIGAYLYGLYRLRGQLDRFSLHGNYLALIGIATLWLLAIRYFLLSLTDARSVVSMVQSTLENFVWLVAFEGPMGFSLNYRRFLFILVIACLVGSYVVMQILVNSPYGRVLKAIRDDENVALSLGKNTFLFKVQSMTIGSAVAGFAGVLAAIYYQALTYTLFHPLVTFFVFLMVILGGKANNKGVILGAGLYWIFVRATVELAGIFPGVIGNRITILRNAIIGLLLVLLLYYKPEGLWKEERFVVEVPE